MLMSTLWGVCFNTDLREGDSEDEPRTWMEGTVLVQVGDSRTGLSGGRGARGKWADLGYLKAEATDLLIDWLWKEQENVKDNIDIRGPNTW